MNIVKRGRRFSRRNGVLCSPWHLPEQGGIRDVRAGLKALANGNCESWIAPKFEALLSGSYRESLQIV